MLTAETLKLQSPLGGVVNSFNLDPEKTQASCPGNAGPTHSVNKYLQSIITYNTAKLE